MYDFTFDELESSEEYQTATPDLQKQFAQAYFQENGADEAYSLFEQTINSEEYSALDETTRTAFENNFFSYFGIEDPRGQPERTALGTAGDIGLTALKGAISVPESAIGLFDIATKGGAGKFLKDTVGLDTKIAKEELDKYYSPAQQYANQQVNEADGFVGTVKKMAEYPSAVAHTALESAPLMGAGGVVGRGIMAVAPKVAPFVAAGLGEGVVGAGLAEEAYKKSTGDTFNTWKESSIAALSGAGTALFGVVGGRVANKFGFDDIDTFLAKGLSSGKRSANVAKSIVGGGISEGAFEELPQSVQEQIWQNAATDRPLLEGVPESAAQGLVVGGAMGAGFNVAAGLLPRTKPLTVDEASQGVSDIPADMNPQAAAELIEEHTVPATEDTQADRDTEIQNILAFIGSSDKRGLAVAKNSLPEVISKYPQDAQMVSDAIKGREQEILNEQAQQAFNEAPPVNISVGPDITENQGFVADPLYDKIGYPLPVDQAVEQPVVEPIAEEQADTVIPVQETIEEQPINEAEPLPEQTVEQPIVEPISEEQVAPVVTTPVEKESHRESRYTANKNEHQNRAWKKELDLVEKARQGDTMGWGFNKESDNALKTPEQAVAQYLLSLDEFNSLDGQLISNNTKVGKTVSPSEMLRHQATAIGIENAIEQDRKENPDRWAQYDRNQVELQDTPVGGKVETAYFDSFGKPVVGTILKKNKKNWSIKFDDTTDLEGKTWAGNRVLIRPESLKPLRGPVTAEEQSDKESKGRAWAKQKLTEQDDRYIKKYNLEMPGIPITDVTRAQAMTQHAQSQIERLKRDGKYYGNTSYGRNHGRTRKGKFWDDVLAEASETFSRQMDESLPLAEKTESGTSNPPSQASGPASADASSKGEGGVGAEQQVGENEINPVLASEFGFKGLAAKKYTVDGIHLGDTKAEAISAYKKAEADSAESAEIKKAREEVYPKLKDGTYSEGDIKKITSTGKESVSTQESIGILRALGLKVADARKMVNATPHIYESDGGTVYRSVADVIERARANGLLPAVASVGKTDASKEEAKTGKDNAQQVGQGTAAGQTSSGTPRPLPSTPRNDVPTKIRPYSGKKRKIKEFDKSLIKEESVSSAAESGKISKEEAAIIDGIIESFPQFKQYLEIMISGQEFAPTEVQLARAGLPKKDQESTSIVGTTRPEWIGKAGSGEVKHVITLFKGHDAVDFVHEFGEFLYERALTVQDKAIVKREFLKDKTKRKSMHKAEWFSTKLEQWWIKAQPINNKGLVGIFKKVLKTIKAVYSRYNNVVDKTVPRELATLFDDIVTNGRDIVEKYAYSADEVVARYITGIDPTTDQIKGQGLSLNQKTGWSFDPSTLCPKQEAFTAYIAKHMADGTIDSNWLTDPQNLADLYDSALSEGIDVPCSYCYVEGGRRKALAYFHESKGRQTMVRFSQAKVAVREVPYVDKILTLPQSDIDAMNARGGLRLFSFSDYIRYAHRGTIDTLLRHANKRGLSVKAITKNPEFVEDFVDTGITINVSIDFVDNGFGMPWDKAAELKNKYSNVKIRTVSRNVEETERALSEPIDDKGTMIDVVTPYHHEGAESIPEGHEEQSVGSKGGNKISVMVDENPEYAKHLCCREGGKCLLEQKDPKSGKVHASQCSSNCGAGKGKLSIPSSPYAKEGKDTLFSKSTAIPGQKEITEDGKLFKTGEPVTFFYAHNTESATSLFGKPEKDSKFGRGFEPSGEYFTIIGKIPTDNRAKNLEFGEKTLNNPLVIDNDSLGWKKSLSDTFGGKTGKRLSQAVIEQGYDGIITIDGNHTSEAIDFNTFDLKKARYSQSIPQTQQASLEELTSKQRHTVNRLRNSGKLELVSNEEAERILQDAGMSAEQAKYMVAWHGSPHDHDGFRSDKIGTGEGVQAFGFGHYFSGKKEVAEFYRTKLAGSGFKYGFFGKGYKTISELSERLKKEGIENPSSFLMEAETRGIETLKAEYKENLSKYERIVENHNNPKMAAHVLTDQEAKSYNDNIKELRAAVKVLDKLSFSRKGKLYQVELAPKDEELLLWDKPLGEQSEFVREILEKKFDSDYGPLGRLNSTGKRIGSGQSIYDLVQSYYIGEGGNEAQKASEYLHSLGIRGIKYLDGTSRNRPLRDIKAEFLAELPEDADIAEVEELVGTNTFSPKNEAVIKALIADDWLGFDYPSQALSAALGGKLSDYDPSPALKKAVADAQEGGSSNFVIFDDSDISITAKYSADGTRIEGFYLPDGKAYLILENIQKNRLWPTIRHEIGIHASKLLQGDKEFTSLLKSIESRMDEDSVTGKTIREAAAKVPKNTAPENVTEETLAYLVSSGKQIGIVRRFIAMLKNALVKLGLNPNIFTADDLIALAESAVRKEAKAGQKAVTGLEINEFAQDAKYSLRRAKRRIQNMAAFKKWFGNSIVTVDGKAGSEPLVVYHGTDRNFEDFTVVSKNKGPFPGSDSGFFFARNPKTADEFSGKFRIPARKPIYVDGVNVASPAVAGYVDGSSIIPAYISIKKPRTIPARLYKNDYVISHGDFYGFSQRLRKKGYDGIVIKKDPSFDKSTHKDGYEFSEDIYVAFEPTQIKSIFNSTWNPSNPDIMLSKAVENNADRGLFKEVTKRMKDSAPFKRWFGKSRMKTRSGAPIPFFHGSATFGIDENASWVFDDSKLGKNTTSPMIGLGHFFTNDRDEAMGYSKGTGNVKGVYLRLENPKIMNSWELPEFDTAAEAAAYRKRASELDGYDGIYLKDLGQAVIFSANQAKSGEFNTGEFSRENNDIRFSIATSQNATVFGSSPGDDRIDRFFQQNPNLKEWWEKLVYQLADKDDPRRLILKRTGKIHTSKTDILMVERLRGKVTADAVEQELGRNLVEPLLKQLSGNKIALKDFEDYAYALHVPERNKRMQQVNAKRHIDEIRKYLNASELRDIDNRLVDLRSEAVMADYTRSELHDKYLAVLSDLFSDIDRMNSDIETRQNELDNRTYTQAEINKGTPANVQGMLDSRKEKVAQIEAIKARWEKESPRYAGITDAEAAQIIYRIIQTGKVDKYEEAQKLLAKINQFKLDTLYESGQISKAEYDSLVDGYDFYVPLHRDPEQTGYTDKPPTTGRITGPTGHPLKVAKGSLSDVVDIVSHSIRNAQQAIVRKHKGKAGEVLFNFVNENPDSGISFTKRDKTPTHDAEGNIILYESRKLNDNEIEIRLNGELYTLAFNTKDKTVKRFLESINNIDVGMSGAMRSLGAFTRFLASVNTMYSPEFIFTNFTRDISAAGINMEDSAAKGMQGKVLKSVFPAIKGILKAEFSNDKTDPWSIAYRDFAKHGAKIGWMQGYEQAADLTKNIESELAHLEGKFVPKEILSKTLGQPIARINTAIENGVRLATYQQLVQSGVAKDKAAIAASNLTVDFTRRGAAGPVINSLYMFFNASVQGNIRLIKAVVRSSGVRKLVGGIFGTGLGLQMLAYALGGDDDSGEPYIDGIPDYIKERNMIFMIPDSGGKYVMLPMPYGYSVFYNVGQEFARAMHDVMRGKKYDAGKGAMRLISSASSSFNPIGSGTLAQTIMPTVLDPIVMIAENKSWTGQDLMPKENSFGIDKADAFRYWKSASVPSRYIAKKLHDYTGGSQGEYDDTAIIDVSPETLDMIWDTFTGSAGRFAKNTLSIPAQMISGEDVEPRNVPFLRKVYGEYDDRAISERYYDEVEKIERQVKNVKTGGNVSNKKQVYQLSLLTKQAEKYIGDLRKKRNSLEERGASTDKIDKLITLRQSAFLKAAEEQYK